MKEHTAYLKSPIGTIKLTATDDAITSILFEFDTSKKEREKPNEILLECKKQLHEYFSGRRKKFELPLKLTGTGFQKSVWKALQKIPYGKTVSYLDIAKTIGNPKAVRAVGMANSKNRIPIIIPCHRVIGENGKLTGYAGGIWRKQWLLEHEDKYSRKDEQMDIFE
jgi:methylated-DNA-[protein]-cysteine S-methyltransferase